MAKWTKESFEARYKDLCRQGRFEAVEQLVTDVLAEYGVGPNVRMVETADGGLALEFDRIKPKDGKP